MAPATLSPTGTGVVKFTNCRLVKGPGRVPILEDLWVSQRTGKILCSQAAFFDDGTIPDQVIDLGGRIISPGLIDVQLNGAFGFNFSTLPESPAEYQKSLNNLNKMLVSTGVMSYAPTLTSQKPELYQKVLPYLGSSGSKRLASQGAESVGAHVEGPFLNPSKNGIHDVEVLIEAETMEDIERCYGKENLSHIKKITFAPERGQICDLIPEITTKGIVCSIGHSEATYEDALKAVNLGATMITHLFNAMRPLHHRNPGVFGVLGNVTHANTPRPYFGIIADGIHLHPSAINTAFHTHPDGFILVTDAMHLMGLPDGIYPWSNGEADSRIIKRGPTLLLEGTDKIAGSSITLIECVNNFLKWSGCTVSEALRAVTETPARMMGLTATKGVLDPGADADLVILTEEPLENGVQLVVDEVWKFGVLVHER